MSNTLDPVKNFAKSDIDGTLAAEATSFSVATGFGERFPQPSTDGAFNITIWNRTDYPDPSDDPDKEIVRCTARTTDAFTIIRAQEGTSDVNHNTGGKVYAIVLSATEKTITDIETALDLKAPTTAPTFATSITGSYLTVSEILGTDASKNIISLPVATYPSLVELAYLKGVTSAIQTQLGARLPLTGGTLTGNLLFTDNTLDIGASGATRPRTGYFGTSIISPVGLFGATANLTDWPTARVVGSQADSAHSYTGNIGVVGESVASATDTGTGVGGVSVTNGANESRGVTGIGKVGATGDTAKANGVYGYVNGIHAGGDNIGVRGSAINGANNYAFYGENGKIYSSGDIELGHLTDTTIHRVSAGVVAIEGQNILTTALTRYKIKTSNYTSVNSDNIYCNTSGGIFTITLPATPTTGDYVTIKSGKYASINNLTIGRNGQTIMSSASDMIISTNNIQVTFIFDGSTWAI